jgi:hypothetical protein
MSGLEMLGRNNVLAREKMFPGENLVLQPEVEGMFAQMSLGLGRMEESALEFSHQLSPEMSSLLQTFWKLFAEAGSAVDGFKYSVENVAAASFMSEKFGPITTAETAPVFKFLGGEIVDAQAFSKLNAGEMQSKMAEIEQMFKAISALVFDSEIEELEKEVEAAEKAEAEVGTTRVGENMGLMMRVDKGRRNMKSKVGESRRKIRDLVLGRNNWLEFSTNLAGGGQRAAALPMAA